MPRVPLESTTRFVLASCVLLYAENSAYAQPSIEDLLPQISPARLESTVTVLARAGGFGSRVTFTAGNDSSARWILTELQRLPLDTVWADTFYATAAVAPWNGSPLTNLLAELRGTGDPGTVVVLGAHYDCSASHEPNWSTAWRSLEAPGADDNATGIAVLLEVARVLGESGFRPKRTILFAAFAAEEYTPAVPASEPDSLRHHLGSARVVQWLAESGRDVVALLNVDMIGYNEQQNYVEFVADEGSSWLAHLARALISDYRLPLSCNEPPFPYNPYSDHETFVRMGFPALLLIENDLPWRTDWPFYLKNPYYHTSQDLSQHLNWGQVTAVAKLALALTVELASGDPFSRDVEPPPQPTLLFASGIGHSFRLLVREEAIPDLSEVRVYNPDRESPWLLPSAPVASFSSLSDSLVVPGGPGSFRFCLTAADTASPPNESARSDCYAAGVGARGRILIVDGFDRWGGSGSWGRPYHWFAALYARALEDLDFSFDTCANELVESGAVDLSAYDAVFWILGDESTRDETFSYREQQKVREYLRSGGRLFVSGSELGWDLGRKGSSADRIFLRDYLRTTYEADDAESYVVAGVGDSPFEGMRFTYGTVPFEEDYPDALSPASGAKLALRYGNGRGAGISFAGAVPGGSSECRVVVLGFPFETIDGDSVRRELIRRTLRFFGLIETSAVRSQSTSPRKLRLRLDAYPNPFNSSTILRIEAEPGRQLTVRVWNARGQLVGVLLQRRADAPVVSLRWTAERLATGMYLVEALQGRRRAVCKVLFVK